MPGEILKAFDILVLNEKSLKHEKSICYKNIFYPIENIRLNAYFVT